MVLEMSSENWDRGNMGGHAGMQLILDTRCSGWNRSYSGH